MALKPIFMAAFLCLGLSAGYARADTLDSFTLQHDIGVPLDQFGNNLSPAFYQLSGQSAYMQSRTNSGTSGGQLDGAEGFGQINFSEIFPPASANDYLTYSYIGVVNLWGVDTNGDPMVMDQSIVIGFVDEHFAIGKTIGDLFPAANEGNGYTEATLVSQFTTVFDSPEFFDMAFGQVSGGMSTNAAIGVFETDCHFSNFCDPSTQLQVGQLLHLVAFNGGPNGDQGVRIGTLETSVVRFNNLAPVPEPETWAMLLAGLGLVGFAARRRLG